ncbi:DUF1177 domain-containing protein [Halanaerobium hydrogeniformans]|uniref:DUF1177 domain-containing protein n=1 Tax=Halanaerobium hydrogeniformans TaxID=656519 RepID=E4RP92_HALHG|nr:DUF1177 domain-containing protein [Halanaerobium hydrogeniformans]ADQ13777.1 protein of unknown function DUF1177 [Halanaerobium hydrogeniformans]
MILKEVIDIYDLLDRADASGKELADYLRDNGADKVEVTNIEGEKGTTDGLKITIEGATKNAPVLGIVGRLGGIGARPEIKGFVSDGDGALTTLAAALKLARMKKRGDQLQGDVVLTTHICPDAPTREHEPVPFMDSPIDMEAMNKHEVCEEMDAILSIDTTKGNRVLNNNGFAISPTIKEGYILKVSEDLLSIMETVTGKKAYVLPVTQQDITPYSNGLFHINSIFQPAVATAAPVVGVAITTDMPVAGCASGASNFSDIESAGRFVIETAKCFTEKKCSFFDEKEYKKLIKLYGDLKQFQTVGIK